MATKVRKKSVNVGLASLVVANSRWSASQKQIEVAKAGDLAYEVGNSAIPLAA